MMVESLTASEVLEVDKLAVEGTGVVRWGNKFPAVRLHIAGLDTGITVCREPAQASFPMPLSSSARVMGGWFEFIIETQHTPPVVPLYRWIPNTAVALTTFPKALSELPNKPLT